jgi:hypothetical protein
MPRVRARPSNQTQLVSEISKASPKSGSAVPPHTKRQFPRSSGTQYLLTQSILASDNFESQNRRIAESQNRILMRPRSRDLASRSFDSEIA